MIAAWIGPAIVAAVISALVTGTGWLVSERQTLRREAQRRRERVVDMQTALLAEIRAGQLYIEGVREQASKIIRAFEDLEGYTPFVPRQIKPVVFEAAIREIHLLPTAIIDPVVLYYQQVAAVTALVEDMQTDRYGSLEAARKRAVYQDYAELMLHQAVLGREAIEALMRSLNIQVEAASDQKSAEARDAGSGSRS